VTLALPEAWRSGARPARPMRTKLISPRFLVPLLLALGLAGCSTEITYTTKTSDGQKVTFTLINGIANHGSAEGLESSVPKLDPLPDRNEHKVVYHAAVMDQSGAGIRSIKVEDVSDEKACVLIEDDHPVLKDKKFWFGASPAYTIDDEQTKWLTYIDQSFKVYRYTITRPDGHTIVLHEGIMIPAYIKTMIRSSLGAKY